MGEIENIRRLFKRIEEGETPTTELESLAVSDQEGLDTLLEGLESSEWRVVIACTHALGRSAVSRERVVQALVDLLGHDELLVKEAAIASLALQGEHAAHAVPSLLKLVENDKEPELARASLRALAKIGAQPDETVPVLSRILVEALDGRSGREILSRLKSEKEFVPTSDEENLLLHRADRFGLIMSALDALSQYPQKSALVWPLVLRFLSFPNAEIREQALGCLSKLKADPYKIVKAVVASLRQILAEDLDAGEVEMQVQLRSLYEQGAAFKDLLSSLWPEPLVAKCALEALESPLLCFVRSPRVSDEEVMSFVTFLKSPEPSVRAHSHILLSARDSLADRLHDEFEAGLSDSELVVRHAALRAYLAAPEESKLWVAELQKLKTDPLFKDDLSQSLLREALRQMGFQTRVPGFDAHTTIRDLRFGDSHRPNGAREIAVRADAPWLWLLNEDRLYDVSGALRARDPRRAEALAYEPVSACMQDERVFVSVRCLRVGPEVEMALAEFAFERE